MPQVRSLIYFFFFYLHSTHNDKFSGADSGSAAVPEQDDVYQVPEYFQYNEFSYYDLDINMLEHRLQQPKPGLKY